MQEPVITIKLNPDGLGVVITGPLNMPALCFGMLQMAHDCIQEAMAETRKKGSGPQLVQAPAGAIEQLKKAGK